MVRHKKLLFLLILGGACAQISCNLVNIPIPNAFTPNGSATDASAIVSNQQHNTVTVDVFIIRFTPHQNELVQQLWRETDEQSLPTQLRRKLHAQGFRAGVFSNTRSLAFEQLLSISSFDAVPDAPSGDFHEFSAADAARESGATRHTRQLSSGMRARLQPFNDQNALPEFFLFRQENGMMHGETFRRAIGSFHVTAESNRDGSAQIQILPVIEHGTPEWQMRPVAGLFISEENRPRHTFDSLAISQRLMPGQWIILGATTLDSPGAGKAFFARTTSLPEQRLLAIRLVRATSEEE